MSGTGGAPSAIGVFGGTFNPVHYGHLRSALEVLEHLQLAEVRLMPCAVPPHRGVPSCSAAHRAAMVELAVAGEDRLVCDRRELQRSGPSYTIDSLLEIRGELGSNRGLCLIMGCDALLGVERWHRWNELLDVAHVVVIARPGWQLPGQGPVASWLDEHRLETPEGLHTQAAGGILVEQLRPLAISSTEIRELQARGESIRYLLPDTILDYIETHKLYREDCPE